MMKKVFSFRGAFFLGFLITALLLGKAAYLQVDEGLSPCPLCVLQRTTFALLSAIFFFGALIHYKRGGRLFFTFLGMMISLVGIIFSFRQVWLQQHPSVDAGECGVSLTYLLKIMPFQEVIETVWRGGAECSRIEWIFWGLSLAEWSLIWFGIFFFMTTVLFFSAYKAK